MLSGCGELYYDDCVACLCLCPNCIMHDSLMILIQGKKGFVKMQMERTSF